MILVKLCERKFNFCVCLIYNANMLLIKMFKVLLHTPHSVPQLRNKYFIVPLDSSVTAAVDPHVMTTSKEVQKYSPEKRLCYFSEERYLCFFKIYTTDNCKLECLTNQTLERCGCVNYHMPSKICLCVHIYF